MDELISKIAAEAGIDPAVARRAVAIIVNFLAREAPADAVNGLIDKLPGARALVSGQLGGGGGIMGAFNDLTAVGLDMGGVQTVARQFVAYARAEAGDQAVNAVVDAVPGLSQFV